MIDVMNGCIGFRFAIYESPPVLRIFGSTKAFPFPSSSIVWTMLYSQSFFVIFVYGSISSFRESPFFILTSPCSVFRIK